MREFASVYSGLLIYACAYWRCVCVYAYKPVGSFAFDRNLTIESLGHNRRRQTTQSSVKDEVQEDTERHHLDGIFLQICVYTIITYISSYFYIF